MYGNYIFKLFIVFLSFLFIFCFVVVFNNNKGPLFYTFYGTKWPLCDNVPLSNHSFIHCMQDYIKIISLLLATAIINGLPVIEIWKLQFHLLLLKQKQYSKKNRSGNVEQKLTNKSP